MVVSGKGMVFGVILRSELVQLRNLNIWDVVQMMTQSRTSFQENGKTRDVFLTLHTRLLYGVEAWQEIRYTDGYQNT